MSTLTFNHPHIMTTVYDNSAIKEIAATADSSVLFAPFFSEKGDSSDIRKFTSLNDFIKETGTPNYKKYGQSQYNIVNWLKNGGVVYGVRLTPADATFANVGLNVRTKAVETTDENGNVTKTVDIKLESIKLPNMTANDDEFIKAAISNIVPANDGYKDHVLFIASSTGKGTYGNNLAMRITTESAFNKTYAFKCYNLSLIETSIDGATKNSIGPAVFSFYPEATTASGLGISLLNVINSYFEGVKMYFNEEAYDLLIDDIMTAVDNAYDNASSIDFIFGDEYCKIDQLGAASLFSSTGIYFEDGTNGSIGEKITDVEGQKVRNSLLTSVFNGTLFPKIFDKRQYPIDVILDACYDLAIKKEINNFVNIRKDCIAILDTCELANPEATVAWKQANLDSDFDNYFSSLWSQVLKLYDTYSVSDITVSPTYYLASKVPSIDREFGVQYPFVGPKRGIIEGYKSINWSPNNEQKEELFNNNINYIEQNYRSSRFMSQSTLQNKKTSLSDINHVRSMLKIIRSVEELCESYLFESATDETLTYINTDLSNVLSQWVANGTCSMCTGECTQTAIEAENKMAHVTVSIVFVDVIEKIMIDINIGR